MQSSGKIWEVEEIDTWWASLMGIWIVLLAKTGNSIGFPGKLPCVSARYKVPLPFRTTKTSSQECLWIGVPEPGANVWSHISTCKNQNKPVLLSSSWSWIQLWNKQRKKKKHNLFHSVQHWASNSHVRKAWPSIVILRKFTYIAHDWQP